MHNGDEHGADPASGHGTTAYPHRGFGEKFIVPLATALGAGLLIAAIVVCVSQILLAVGENVATPIALIVALIVLLGCSYFATARRVSRQVIVTGVALPAIALIAGGVFAGIYHRNHPAESPGSTEARAAVNGGNLGTQPAAEVMTDNKFSSTTYQVQANKATTITLQNKGKALHNFHILNVNDASGQEIKTDLVQPGESKDLSFSIAQEGTYSFQCDVHPTEMKGTITVVPSNSVTTAATASGGPAAAGGLSEITTDNKFSQTALSADHGVSVGLTVQNKGSALHNFHVLNAKNADGSEIKTELVAAGKTATITFQIDQPGSYDYQCDIHPTEMKGKLTIK